MHMYHIAVSFRNTFVPAREAMLGCFCGANSGSGPRESLENGRLFGRFFDVPASSSIPRRRARQAVPDLPCTNRGNGPLPRGSKHCAGVRSWNSLIEFWQLARAVANRNDLNQVGANAVDNPVVLAEALAQIVAAVLGALRPSSGCCGRASTVATIRSPVTLA
ncbi:MAG TPA: hypothetical protein VHZ24_14705 [Pirellulales bacterium]|nr:hypothetical protein [Pirellulales bacterium]